MAVDLIDGNSTRYFSVPDHADLTFPDADWFLAFWTRVEDNSGGLFQYLFSNNNFEIANSLNIYLAEVGSGVSANKWGIATDTSRTFSEAATGADNVNRLIVVQRVSGNLEMWLCLAMATASRVINTLYSDGAINGGVWNIGRRVDGNTGRYYEEHFGDFIKGSVSLTQAQIELLGRGVPPYLVTDYSNLDVWFQFRENAATVVDLINGHIATRQGTGLATSEHFPVISADIILINPTAAVGGAISGSTSITVTPGGNLKGQGKLSGATTATVTPTGTLRGTGDLSGAVAIAITSSGTLRGTGDLSGAITTTFIPSGTLKGAGLLSGAVGVVVTPTGTLIGAGSLSGTASLILTPTGTLTGLGGLSGSTTITLTPSGTLSGLGGGVLSGSIALALIPTGTLKGLGGLSGATSITVTVSGTLKAPGALVGAASLTLTPTGTLRGEGTLAGQATIVVTVTGSLTDAVSGAISGAVIFTLTPTGTLEGRGAPLPVTVIAAPSTNPLLFTESIVDQQGRPTKYFLRQWLSQRGVNASTEATIDELNVLVIQVAAIRGINLLAGVGLDGGGDLSGPDRTFDLADTAVTPGDYTNTNLTVDQQGRIVAAASGGGGGGGDPYGIAPVVPLVVDFTLINAGSATFIDTTFGIFMRVPIGGSSNIRFLNPVMALPATPWAMTARMRLVHPETNLARVTTSLVLRNSGTGRIIIFGDHQTGYLIQRWSGFGTFNSSILTLRTGYKMSDVPWKRVVNDGTDLSFEVSPDGESWAALATEPLATYVSSVDQAGAGTWSNNIETSIVLQSFVLA